MADLLILGRKRIQRRDVALVERFEGGRKFGWPIPGIHSRVVLLNRDSLLIAEPVRLFARENAFLMIDADLVALNPDVAFCVEPFLADERFIPAQAFASRLAWSDPDGNTQSKLLLSYPETVETVLSESHASVAARLAAKDNEGTT